MEKAINELGLLVAVGMVGPCDIDGQVAALNCTVITISSRAAVVDREPCPTETYGVSE